MIIPWWAGHESRLKSFAFYISDICPLVCIVILLSVFCQYVSSSAAVYLCSAFRAQKLKTDILTGPSTESTPQVYQGRRSFQLSQSYLPSPVNEPVYPNSAVNGLDATRAQNDPSSSAPHELDADAYVITNYYPSDESQTTSEQGNPNQADNYPLKHRLSQRRGGSLERPAATTFTERPWRHSDSMTPRESRPVQPDGIHAPPVDGRSSWYRANSPTTSPAVARAHRLSLPPTSSRGPSDGERSVSSGNGTMTASSSTRSERAPDQIRHEVDGQPAHPMLESPASSPLAAGRQRPLSYHDGQAAEAERPAVGPRQRSRLFGLRVSNSQAHHVRTLLMR